MTVTQIYFETMARFYAGISRTRDMKDTIAFVDAAAEAARDFLAVAEKTSRAFKQNFPPNKSTK